MLLLLLRKYVPPPFSATGIAASRVEKGGRPVVVATMLGSHRVGARDRSARRFGMFPPRRRTPLLAEPSFSLQICSVPPPRMDVDAASITQPTRAAPKGCQVRPSPSERYHDAADESLVRLHPPRPTRLDRARGRDPPPGSVNYAARVCASLPLCSVLRNASLRNPSNSYR